LGNPGAAYRKTRHNVGFMIADDIASVWDIQFKKRDVLPDVLFGKARICGRNVVMVKPTAFMNRAGPPVAGLMKYFDIPCEDLIVVHDDIDLVLGRIKIMEKGGHGGHKGVKSMIDAMGSDHFTRIRIGVGRSEFGASVTDHVLGKFSSEELKIFEQIREKACSAVETILCQGVKEGMNRFNTN
jgi:PTH1 family peptidyl-tRNA hydrolase